MPCVGPGAMAGSGLLPLVLVMSFGLGLLSGVTDTVPKECYVQHSINHSVWNNKSLEASFWGNVKNDHPFMEMKLKKNTDIMDHFIVTFNLTHVKVHEVTTSDTTPVSVEVMPGLVCQGWRLFRLVLSGSKLLTVTDDHNTTWIDREFNSSVSNLEITVDNFNSSCITLTPIWHVVKGTLVNMTLPSPQQQEDLRFTLLSKVDNAKPKFLIGKDTVNLDMVLPRIPTHLRLKQTPGAVPGKVAANTWEQVIEIGNTTSVGVRASGDILILQHLGCRVCPLSAGEEDCCCIPDFVLAFMWIAAVSSVVTYLSLKRIFELITNQVPSDNPPLRPPSPEAIYEEIIASPWL